MGGEIAEKSSFTIVKRIAAECVFELNRNVWIKKIMDENSIRDDVAKNNCEKNVDQNQFRENNSS